LLGCSTRVFQIHRSVLTSAQLIDSYAVYGEADATIRDGQKFLTLFERVESYEVASRLADAYAQKNQSQQEFALYEVC